MRVVLACDWFLKYAARLSVALSSSGADVALVCRTHALEFASHVEERQQLLDECQKSGVEVVEVAGRFASIQSARSLVRVSKILREWRPDVFHAQENYDPRLLVLARPYPAVLTIHDVRPHIGATEIGRSRGLFRNAWIRAADRIVVHGDTLRSEAENLLGPKRLVVIPHGLDPLPRPLPIPSHPAVLLFGRIEPYKGLDVLLEAMNLVWAVRPDVTVTVVGQGPDASRIPLDARIDARIGYWPEAEVDELLASASLVVLPYLVGSQSGVGSLAVSRGIPTLVTNVGSLPDLTIDPSFVVRPGDAPALASAILQHVKHSVQVREAILEHARKQLSWTAVAVKTLGLYHDLLNGGGRSPVTDSATVKG
jgi:glycosyltransferase involved in cell wall biosynthesis